MNTAIAAAEDSVKMAMAMRLAVEVRTPGISGRPHGKETVCEREQSTRWGCWPKLIHLLKRVRILNGMLR